MEERRWAMWFCAFGVGVRVLLLALPESEGLRRRCEVESEAGDGLMGERSGPWEELALEWTLEALDLPRFSLSGCGFWLDISLEQ